MSLDKHRNGRKEIGQDHFVPNNNHTQQQGNKLQLLLSHFLWPRRHTIYLLVEVTAVWVAHIVRVQHWTTIIVGIYCTSKRDSRVVGVGMVRMVVVIIIVVLVLAIVVIRRQEHVSGFSKSFRVFTVRLPVSSCCQTTDDYNDFVRLERNNTLAKCSQGFQG